MIHPLSVVVGIKVLIAFCGWYGINFINCFLFSVLPGSHLEQTLILYSLHCPCILWVVILQTSYFTTRFFAANHLQICILTESSWFDSDHDIDNVIKCSCWLTWGIDHFVMLNTNDREIRASVGGTLYCFISINDQMLMTLMTLMNAAGRFWVDLT